jgi:acyl carrier protein
VSDPYVVEEKLIALGRQFAPGLSGSGAVARTQPLSEAGLSALATVRLMLAIESTFAIAIPDADVRPENFATLGAIEALIVRRRGVFRTPQGVRAGSAQPFEPAAPMQQPGRLGAEADRLHGADDDRVGVTL